MSALVHSVHFYEKDAALIQRLWSLTISSLGDERSVVLIVTSEHETMIRRYFTNRGLDCKGLEARGVLSLLNAESILQRFTRGSKLDRDAFHEVVGGLISSAAEFSERKTLMAFGEMVAILWGRGQREAAMELEQWWNRLIEQRGFHLHCAYPKRLFYGYAGEGEMEQICTHHSIALGTAAVA